MKSNLSNLNSTWFIGKKVTVMGLGVHGGGLGVAVWLLVHGAHVTVTDNADAEKLSSSVKQLDEAATKSPGHLRYVLGHHDLADFTGADLVIKNPACANEFIAAAERSGVPVETDISLLFRLWPHPLVGVTGTKGKTTVATLIHEISLFHDADSRLGGNVRISPLDWLDETLALGRTVPITLELSSWQLEGVAHMKTSPHIGIITNILPDHLNRYDGIDDYAQAKELCVAFQKKGDWAILNYEDSRLMKLGVGGSSVPGATDAGRKFWFAERPPQGKDGCFVIGGKVTIVDRHNKIEIMPVSEIKLPGRHNLLNVLAAVAATYAMGIKPEVIRALVKNFSGVPGRLEVIAEKRGIKFVNDTTATMPDASVAAMEALGHGRNIILITGGADKELEFAEWAKVVARRTQSVIVFPGTATDKILAALSKHSPNSPIVKVGNMTEAVKRAMETAVEGDIILLSPGCASFGLFKNEFHRGDMFTEAVGKV